MISSFIRIMMDKEYKQQLPTWYNSKEKYDLILTDDIDSLLSCAILKEIKQWEIEQVLLFKADKNKVIDYLGKTSNATNEAVGVDLALQSGKCFDNHVTRISSSDELNNESINPNIFKNVTGKNYTSKYNLSTVLLLWSLYNLPMPKTEEGKMILLAIDSSYISYYSSYSFFNQMNKYYLCDVLGLEELYECQKRHKEYEFTDIIRKYKLKSKIIVKKGILQTDINLKEINCELFETNIYCELPEKRFHLDKIFQDIIIPITGNKNLIDIAENPFCAALTKKGFLCYSKEIIEEKKK